LISLRGQVFIGQLFVITLTHIKCNDIILKNNVTVLEDFQYTAYIKILETYNRFDPNINILEVSTDVVQH
jgi:hypothetical protein